MLTRGNLFAAIPSDLPREQFDLLHSRENVRIERILSRGQASPAEGWYDQAGDEWVALLAGEAELELESGERIILRQGDWLTIPAHVRHRVVRTSEMDPCVWLAVHMGSTAIMGAP